MIYAKGEVYEGEWKNNRANGFGYYQYSNGCKYEGQWLDDS